MASTFWAVAKTRRRTEGHANMKYETRITQVTVVKEGSPIFDQSATEVRIEDDGGGEFLELVQHPDDRDGDQILRFDPKEWDAVVEAVEQLRKGMR